MTHRMIVGIFCAICVLGVSCGQAADDGTAPSTRPATQTHSPMGIVFVCDASDTMVPKMDTLRRELIATINGLRPVQSFNVVFMRDKGCAKVSEDLLLGTPENKQRAEKFIKDFKAGGKTNPSPALKAAFEQQPQLIYLLFDHEFADMAHLPGRIVELNGDHKVKVDTIAFLGDEEPNADFIRVLEQIARENKGSFNQKKVSDL